jgi:hypothetical protein
LDVSLGMGDIVTIVVCAAGFLSLIIGIMYWYRVKQILADWNGEHGTAIAIKQPWRMSTWPDNARRLYFVYVFFTFGGLIVALFGVLVCTSCFP